MRLGLFIFLWSICLVGSTAIGNKFVLESETIQLEDCEPADADESEASHPYLSDLTPSASVENLLASNRMFCLFDFPAIREMAPDCFFTPPDQLRHS